MRRSRLLLLLGVLVLGLVACGGSDGDEAGETTAEAVAACTGTALSEAPKLPQGWPDMAEVTFTKQSTRGPTEIVEGYFDGDIEAAHDDFKRELEAAGFEILFDEVEEHDSEVSWKGEGRSGQIALREECGASDQIYVKITNRPV